MQIGGNKNKDGKVDETIVVNAYHNMTKENTGIYKYYIRIYI
jgi:hypothetical protein